MLPAGSKYVGKRYPQLKWSEEYTALMDIKELVFWCCARLSGETGELPKLVMRPGDRERMIQASIQSKKVKDKLNNGSWEEA